MGTRLRQRKENADSMSRRFVSQEADYFVVVVVLRSVLLVVLESLLPDIEPFMPEPPLDPIPDMPPEPVVERSIVLECVVLSLLEPDLPVLRSVRIS
jgi:hypothetical protein